MVGDGKPIPEKNYTKVDNFIESKEMANEIRKYGSDKFIIVVSNYAFEKYLGEDLVKTLENCGAFQINEF